MTCEYLLRDREECEGKLRAHHFFRCVLVPVFQPGESADPHHQSPFAALHHHARRFRWDFHRDAEPGLHHIDARLMAGVETADHAARDELLCLFHRKGLLTDGAVGGEHRGGDTETELCFCIHMTFLLLIIA